MLLVLTPLIPSEGSAELGTGSLLIMAGVALAAIAWNARILLNQPSFWWQWGDAALLALVAAYVVSGLVMAEQGNPRATINAVWQWIGFGAVYFLARQIFRRAVDRRALAVVLLAVATMLSAVSFHEYFFSMPRLRARYAAEPERVLQEAGVQAIAGTAERRLFEDRLHSSPPIATFALTNSLAGFLAPWLIVALGIGWQVRRAGGVHPVSWRSPVMLGLLIAGGVISFCLLLTTSRSALFAVLCGGAAVTGLRRIGRGLDRRLLLATGLIVTSLVGAAWAAGAFDWLTVSEAPKSLLYRFEYWQASWSLIAEHPWFGCGPGNFQQYYAFYKLPQASETIADPHNFLVEVWSNAGTPALLALASFLVLVARSVWISGSSPALHGRQEEAGCAGIEDSSSRGWIWLGALLGVLGAFPVGAVVGFPPPAALFWAGIPLAVLTIALFDGWVCGNFSVRVPSETVPDATIFPAWLWLVALLVLLINLLAAGGISYAGVSTSVWLLAALALNSSSRDRRVRVPVWLGGALGAVLLVLVVLCQRSMYGPVLAVQSKVREGWSSASVGRWEAAEEAFRAATVADPFSSQAWLQLAALYHERLLRETSPERVAGILKQFDRAVEEAQQRNRRGFALRRQVGDWRFALYRRWDDGQQLGRAILSYKEAARLYPHGIAVRAQLAWSHHLAGQAVEAGRQAREAIRLDAITPHRDRKLENQVLFDPLRGVSGKETVEQLMHHLRRLSDLERGAPERWETSHYSSEWEESS